MAEEDISQPPSLPIASPEASQMVSSVKLLILKKGEYILWTIKMEYGKTRERKAKSSLLMAIQDENLVRFHGIKDGKILWAAIKTRFDGNVESKKMQKNAFKAGVSTEDANQKLLKSLPSAWRNISLIMRNKHDIDNLDIDDLYNNLKVYEADIKSSSRPPSNSQNVAFISIESTTITNEINAAYSVSTATCHSSQAQEESWSLMGKNQLVLIKPRLSALTVIEEGTLPGITDQPGIQGTGVEMLGMQGTEDDMMIKEEEATDFAFMAFTSNPSSSSSLNSEEEVTETMFDNCSSEEKNSLTNDRFKKGEGYHAVPPPLTGNYMPPKSDLLFVGLDDSIYKFKISETVASLIKDEKDAPKTSTAYVEKLKEDRSTGESVKHVKPVEFVKHVKPIEFVKHVKPVKTAKQTKKSKKFSSSLKVDRKDWNGKMTQKLGLGFGFTKKACFVCGSMSHLIKDCTFHEDGMAKKSVLPTNVGKRTGHKEISDVKGNKVTGVKTSAGCVWRPRVNEIDQLFKYNRWIYTRVDYGHPQQALENKGIVDSGCSRHMTKNKAYLADYQELMKEVLLLLVQVENVVPSGDLTCLFAKASIDESNLWHMRLGHLNFKTINKLVTGNLARGLPLKIFDNGHSYVAYQKGKQHKATWIKREYSNARTSQQNGVAERKNRTLIEAARTILADSLLPITFWAEAVNTACYVLNRAIVTKTHNKTPNELLNGRTPRLDFIRPFSCPVTILNNLGPLGKIKGKADEGFLVGYSVTSKAFRVFNTKTRKVKENMHVKFLENKSNVVGTRPNWLFDIDSLTNSMNHILVSAGNQTDKYAGPQDTNGNSGNQDNIDAGKEVSNQHYIMLPLWSSISSTFKSSDNKAEDDKNKDDIEKEASDAADALRQESEQGCMDQRGATKAGSTNPVNTVSNPVNAASTSRTFSAGRPTSPHLDTFILSNTLLHVDQDDSQAPNLEDTAKLQCTGIFNSAYDDELDIFTSPVQSVGVEANFNNMKSSTIIEPKKVSQALDDKSWVKAIQEELLQFSLQKVWRLVNLPYGQKAIGTKWVYKNKKDKRGIVVRNKASFDAKKIPDEFHGGAYFLLRTAVSTPLETQKPLVRDEEAADVDVHLYRSMIRSLMYLTASRSDIKFTLCACSRDFPFDLEAYSKSNYAGANLDRKSTTRGCQFLEYVAAANYCRQVFWIQNQMLDYGFNFMHNTIYIDNESTICIVKNLVYHSKTKHIEIRHHFIRDSYEKKLIQVWTLVDLPYGKKAIGTKWIYKNKKDDRGIVVRNKARIEAIRLFFAYASFKDFIVYQMDVKSVFLYEKIEEEVYFCQPPGFKDPKFLDRVYKVEKALYDLHQAPRAWYETLFTYLLDNGFHKASTTMETSKPLLKDAEAEDVDVHLYRFQVTPKVSHLHAVKRIFRYLKVNSVKQIHAIVDGKAVVILESSVRSYLLLNDEDDAQTRFETASKKSRDLPLSKVNTFGSGEDRIEHPDDLTNFVPPTPHDSPLLGCHTPGSDEGRFKTPTDKSLGEDESKQGRNDDKIEELNLTDVANIEVIVQDKGSGEKGGSTSDQVSTAKPEVYTASVPVNVSVATLFTPLTTTSIFGDEDLIIAQTLINLMSEKAKVEGVSFRDIEEPPRLTKSTTTLQPLPTIDPKDKGKGIVVEEEPEKLTKVKRRDQCQIDADHEISVRMTHEEQEKYTIEERARLLPKYFKRKKKKLAAERAEAIRNKPPTRTQVRNRMITYLKHMEPKSKGKKGKRIKRVADSALKQKSFEKQKMMQEQESIKSDEEESADYEHEKEELRMWLIVVSDKEETMDPEILSTKYLIVDWESQNLSNVDMEDLHVP
nr:hypothetical protein [Tanacetum cinerariifolium]